MTVNRHTTDAFLGKRLNRFSKFWYQVKAVDPVHVNTISDFAYSPRVASPSSFNFVAKQ